MIIKFQIYSILHPIPSKGILESHTNALLNRNRILLFILQFSFLVLVTEKSLPPTFIPNLRAPPQSKCLPEVLSAPGEGPGPLSSGVLLSPTVLSKLFRRQLLCAFPACCQGQGAVTLQKWPQLPVRPVTLLGTRRIHFLTSLSSVSPSVTRGVDLDSRRVEGTLPVTFWERKGLQRVK